MKLNYKMIVLTQKIISILVVTIIIVTKKDNNKLLYI